MDHLRTNPTQGVRWLVPPPRCIDQTEVDVFAKELLDHTIPEKLSELIKRYELLEKNRSIEMERLRNLVRRGAFKSEKDPDLSEYFWTYFINTKFSETIMIRKWIRYWLSLSEMASKKKITKLQVATENEELTQEEIDRAKDYPIARLYEGDLQTSFNRMVGLCPFHDEKTPSFAIFEDNHFYCFGCNVWGDAIDFYMKTKGGTMREAVKALQYG